ncbi:hypothetical protein [Kordia sp.]|uniref:hypothetical protein n=1 Tax=Kordia sp. TaxID=1965332 RepID=UPI003D6BF407
MKKRKANDLQIQKKTISNLNSCSVKGGTNTTFTLDPLNSMCVCRTDIYCQASLNCTT